MNIQGIGILFNRGLGIGSLEAALKEGWKTPSAVESPLSKEEKTFAYLVDLDAVPDRTILKKIRRSDKLSKMAVLAAADALCDSGTEITRARTGIIVATAFGAHVTTFEFLDGILDYGEAGVSPTVFSNSVHNAAASYIASVLDIHGPTLTVTQFHHSFHYALQLAQVWLREGRCDHVLVGAVDQYGDVMNYIYRSTLTPSPDGRIRPFQFSPVHAVPGEGAVFFFLGREKTEHCYCRVESIRFNEVNCAVPSDLTIIDADGTLSDESVYLSALTPKIPVAAYTPLFGSTMSSSAFNCAAGALMLRSGVCFANPVADNPHGIAALSGMHSENLELIRCIRYNCRGRKAAISLLRQCTSFEHHHRGGPDDTPRN